MCGSIEGNIDHHGADISEPRFEVTASRKFEVIELCGVFFNKWVRYLYLAMWVLTAFLILWAFCTVGGSSWASNIPFNFSGVVKCESDAFLHNILPVEETCRNAYYFSLFIFALIVVPLSVLDLKEQAVIQMLLGLTSFLIILAIVIYSIAGIAQGGNACTTHALSTNTSDENATDFINVSDIILKFDPKGWLISLPVFIYSLAVHPAVPSLTHPIRQKKNLHHLMIVVYGIMAICYLSLGVTAPLSFKADIQESVTLNFTELTSSEHSIALRLLAYFIILFPPLNVASAYPLAVHTTVNELYVAITGHHISICQSCHETKWPRVLLRVSLRFLLAILPIVAGLFVANLVYVLEYAGLMSFVISLFFPTALQLRSIYVCKKAFAPTSTSRPQEMQHLLSNSQENSKKSINLQKLMKARSEYMTPFSNKVFSHPITVVIIGILDVCAFMLGVASLFVSPTELVCL